MVAEFTTRLAKIAFLNGLSTEEVQTMWKKYAYECRCYDQSPIVSEFLKWNSATLVNLPEGEVRLG